MAGLQNCRREGRGPYLPQVCNAILQFCNPAILQSCNFQYAFANQASAAASPSQRTHLPDGLGPSSGMLRIVACVSALICASQSADPHHPAITNPGRPSI